MRNLVAGCCLLLILLPVPARALDQGPGQFVVRCPHSHTLMDDPIVFPNQPGASHLHDFFGNETADADSTVASMLAGDTTCRVASDTAGYWTPTAYLRGRQIQKPVARIYYLGRANSSVETIPPGLQMIAGNKLATSPEENPHVSWYCGETLTEKTPRLPQPYDCRPWAAKYGFVDSVIAVIDFPSCWDGTGLTPDDVAYPTSGACPSEFPHAIPKLSQRVHYDLLNPLNPDGSVAITLSSGAYFTMHADFWNTWQQGRLDQLVTDCLDAHVRCHAVEAGAELRSVAQFGTAASDVATAVTVGQDGPFVAGSTDARLPGQPYHGGSDIFVRAYDSLGAERWTRELGTAGTDRATAVAATSDGVYVAGVTDRRFPKQQGTHGGQDVAVAKLGVEGRLLWIRQFGTRADDRATGVSVAPSGVYVSGTTGGALEPKARVGKTDAFVAKLTPGGEIAWIRQFGSHVGDEATGLSAWGTKVYVVGTTEGSMTSRPLGGVDGFIRLFRSDGSLAWTRQFGTAGDDAVSGVSGFGLDVYVTGSTNGAFPDVAPSGGIDAFVRRFNDRGGTEWTRQLGTSADDDAASVVADRHGVYMAGSTSGTLPGQTQLGGSDAFVAKYLPTGAAMWTLQFGTGAEDLVHGAALDPLGVWVVGQTQGAFDGQSGAGLDDAFLGRIRFT